MQTDFNTVIGGYNPEEWEDTTDLKGGKPITSGFPFLFYWVRDEIQIIKHRDDRIPYMRSDKDYLIDFSMGLRINADQNEDSYATADKYKWVHPENTGNLKFKDSYGYLYFAGGDDWDFKCLDVEVWGLH